MESVQAGAPSDPRREVLVVTVTIDISRFSLQVGEVQERWYKRLRNIVQRVLQQTRVEISGQVSGGAFWSPGGDGGTISIIEGGVSKGLDLAIAVASELHTDNEIAAAEDQFELTMGIDHGPAIVGLDTDRRPNVWGEAINFSNRTSSACEPGYILATKRYVELLLRQRQGIDKIVGQPHKRLVKHGQFIEVYNIHDPDRNAGKPLSKHSPVDVADFEAPFVEMIASYRAHLDDVIAARSGIWTLLLARRLHDMGALSDQDFNHWVSTVSIHGPVRDAKAPTDPFFTSFGERVLQTFMTEGKFARYTPGEVICKIGEQAHDFFIVARGRIEIRIRSQTVAYREPGDVVGEMALVEPGSLCLRHRNPTRTATMVAETDVTLFAIPYSAVRTSAKDAEEVSATFVRFYRERQKESVLAKLPFFQSANEKDKIHLQSWGTLVGARKNGEAVSIRLTTRGLIVCCLGRGKVEHDRRSVELNGDSIQCAWISQPQSRTSSKKLQLIGNGAAEFVVWSGESWDRWISDLERKEGPLNAPDRVTGTL